MDVGWILAHRRQTLELDEHAGAEERGQHGDELVLGEHMGREPDPEVRALEGAGNGRVHIGRGNLPEGTDVDEQDAEDGKAPQAIQAGKTGPGRDHGVILAGAAILSNISRGPTFPVSS